MRSTNKKPGSGESGSGLLCEVLFDHFDVLGHGALLALHDFEFNALVLVQFVAETCSGDLISVHEYVIFTVINLNEAVTFARVEPLHRTLCHYLTSLKTKQNSIRMSRYFSESSNRGGSK